MGYVKLPEVIWNFMANMGLNWNYWEFDGCLIGFTVI